MSLYFVYEEMIIQNNLRNIFLFLFQIYISENQECQIMDAGISND